MSLVISVTGHRPDKIPDPKHVTAFLGLQYGSLDPDVVIVGMAAGVDLWAGALAVDLDIPVIAARPWAGHVARKGDEAVYEYIIDNAKDVVNVDEAKKYPGVWVYNKRNEWMVDHSRITLAVWDGSDGGTGNCISYAIKRDQEIYRFDPLTREITHRESTVPF